MVNRIVSRSGQSEPARQQSTAQAQEVCKAIRDCIAEVYDTDTAEKVRIQIRRICQCRKIAAELFAQPDIDGGLVGGASLKG